MISSNMTLKQMIDFKPRQDEMLELPLDVVVYLKVTVVSYAKQLNYDFIRFFLTDEEIPSYFKDVAKTPFYDFDGTGTKEGRFVTIFELYCLMNVTSANIYLEELMGRYSHECDVIIDLYTHDDKIYRLGDIDGVVKLDQLI